MELYLIRHGEAEPGQPDDAGRNLTSRGAAQAVHASRWIKKTAQGPTKVWASPFIRTQQTAAPIAEALGTEVTQHHCLTPDMTPEKVVNDLTDQTGTLVLVTHLPLVGRLASLLTEGSVFDQPWSPAEVWRLEGDVFAAGCLTSAEVWYPALEEL